MILPILSQATCTPLAAPLPERLFNRMLTSKQTHSRVCKYSHVARQFTWQTAPHTIGNSRRSLYQPFRNESWWRRDRGHRQSYKYMASDAAAISVSYEKWLITISSIGNTLSRPYLRAICTERLMLHNRLGYIRRAFLMIGDTEPMAMTATAQGARLPPWLNTSSNWMTEAEYFRKIFCTSSSLIADAAQMIDGENAIPRHIVIVKCLVQLSVNKMREAAPP